MKACLITMIKKNFRHLIFFLAGKVFTAQCQYCIIPCKLLAKFSSTSCKKEQVSYLKSLDKRKPYAHKSTMKKNLYLNLKKKLDVCCYTKHTKIDSNRDPTIKGTKTRINFSKYNMYILTLNSDTLVCIYTCVYTIKSVGIIERAMHVAC